MRRTLALVALLAGALLGSVTADAAPTSPAAVRLASTPHRVSTCAGQNAEVEQAVDRHSGYVYEEWMGCRGIAFARSRDEGRTWSAAIAPPGSVSSNGNSWDPALAIGPDGVVYAAFMRAKGGQWYPIVDASFDHGRSFQQSSALIPPDAKNWGDRDFIAVGPATANNPHGTVYLTYDYGPERTSVTFICSKSGSCAFLTGDLNVVMQQSTDGGKTWSPMSYVSPGFPASGGDSAPLVVDPAGRIDVLYQGYRITNTTTYAMKPAYSYFTASVGCHVISQHRGGLDCDWSKPVLVGGASSGTMSLWEWWIDGDISIDAAGTLYATWDTQVSNKTGTSWSSDTGWLSYSTDRGRTWSPAVQVPRDASPHPHIMEVAGGGPGVAYVSWLSDSNGLGYAEYLRAYRVGRGFVCAFDGEDGDRCTLRVSRSLYGNSAVWPGDTTGISTLSEHRVALSWGSTRGPARKQDQIWMATVTLDDDR